MNIFRHPLAALGITAAAAASLLASPANAQGYRYHGVRAAQMRQAARLDQRASREASHGHFRIAQRLHAQAARLRSAARHGY